MCQTPDYPEEYVYTGGETLDDDSILGSCIKQVYTSLAEEDGQNGSFSEQEGNAQINADTENIILSEVMDAVLDDLTEG